MVPLIGAVTLGQSPRNDAVPGIAAALGMEAEFVEAGALDPFEGETLEGALGDLRPEPGEWAHASRLRGGGSTGLMSHARLVAHLQRAVDEVVDRGAEIVTVLCAADWSELSSTKPILNAGPLCDGIVNQLASGKKLGVIRPRPDTEDEAAGRMVDFERFGIEVHTRVVNPYSSETTLDDFARASEELRSEGVDILYLACMGMDAAMKDAARATSGCTVLNAQGLIASVLDQLMLGKPL